MRELCVEVVNISTRDVRVINLEEKKVFFDEQSNTFQEVKTKESSNYDNDNPKKKTKVLSESIQ
jgi:hypothetical protein